MDLQRAFRPARVVNKAQFSEPVHKKADAGTSRPYHVGQGFFG